MARRVDRDVRLPWRIEMKERGPIEPGLEGRDERDAHNINIDEEAEGRGRVVEAAGTGYK